MPSRSARIAIEHHTAMNAIDITDMTEAELEKEFAHTDGSSKREGEEREDEKGEEKGRDSGRSSRSVSTDSLTTVSGQSLTDQPASCGRTEGPGEEDGEEEGKEGKRARRNSAHAVWRTVKKAGAELNEDTRKMFRFIGRKLHSRHGPRQTKVKKVHILPGEDDDRMWARRIAGSAHSQSSSGSDPST